MGRNYVPLLAVFFAMIIIAGPSYAVDPPANPAVNFNQNNACTSSTTGFVRPLILCFTGVAYNGSHIITSGTGVIPNVTFYFLKYMSAHYLPIVQLLFLVVVTIFGLKLTTGGIEKPKEETFKLVFKIAGIMIFMTSADTIYGSLLTIMQGLGDDISRASVSLNAGGFCNSWSPATDDAVSATGNSYSWSNQGGSNLLWNRWDCIFNFIFGLTGAGIATSGIGSFLFFMLIGSGAGVAVFFIGLYIIISLFYIVARAVHVYLMSVIGLSVMMCLGFLFVPLLIIEVNYTRDMFKRWRDLVIGYMLTPIFLLGYMGMMLVALDIALFSGTYSIMHSIDPTVATGGNAFASATQYIAPTFKGWFDIDLGNFSLLPNSRAVDGGTIGPLNSLTNTDGSGNYVDMSSENYAAKHMSAAHANVGLNFNKLDIVTLANHAGKSLTVYLSNIVISFAVAALLAYIMLSLLSYIQKLAGNLASQNTSAGNITKSQVLGEAEVRATLEAAQLAAEVAIGAAITAATGGVGGVAMVGARGAAVAGKAASAAKAGASAAKGAATAGRAASGAAQTMANGARQAVQRASVNMAKNYAQKKMREAAGKMTSGPHLEEEE